MVCFLKFKYALIISTNKWSGTRNISTRTSRFSDLKSSACVDSLCLRRGNIIVSEMLWFRRAAGCGGTHTCKFTWWRASQTKPNSIWMKNRTIIGLYIVLAATYFYFGVWPAKLKWGFKFWNGSSGRVGPVKLIVIMLFANPSLNFPLMSSATVNDVCLLEIIFLNASESDIEDLRSCRASILGILISS